MTRMIAQPKDEAHLLPKLPSIPEGSRHSYDCLVSRCCQSINTRRGIAAKQGCGFQVSVSAVGVTVAATRDVGLIQNRCSPVSLI